MTSWDQTIKLFELLSAFQHATTDLSGVYYPTAHKVLFHCAYIAIQFNECSQDPELAPIIYRMVQKWLKYFAQIPWVFLIAKCLDPQYKLDSTFTFIDTYYDALGGLAFIGPDEYHLCTLESLQIPDPTYVKSQLKTKLYEAYTKYCAIYRHLQSNRSRGGGRSQGGRSSTSSRGSSNPLLARIKSVMSQSSSGGSSSQHSELEQYLAEPFVPECMQQVGGKAGEEGFEEVDVLRWWSRRQDQTYPILAAMAREFFAVPASTVAVEQAFSSGGYILDARRSSLTAESVEASVLLKDWGCAVKREQEADWKHIIWDSDEEDAQSETSCGTNADDGLGDADFDF